MSEGDGIRVWTEGRSERGAEAALRWMLKQRVEYIAFLREQEELKRRDERHRFHADGNGSTGLADHGSTEDNRPSKWAVHGGGPGVDRVDLNGSRSPWLDEQQKRHDQEGL